MLNVFNCEKILDVLIDDELTFKDHVYSVCKES